MTELKQTPPIFPILVSQAKKIFLEMLGNVQDWDLVNPEKRLKIDLHVQQMLEKSFWNAIYAKRVDMTSEFVSCLERVYDNDLELYWKNFRKSSAPPLIRPVSMDILNNVEYLQTGLATDIKTFGVLLQDLDLSEAQKNGLLANLKTLCEILALDAWTLSSDFCSQSKEEIKFEISQIRKSEHFQPQTLMISKNSYFLLTGVVAIGALAYSIHRQKVLNDQMKSKK